MLTPGRPGREDAGFTLIELLISIVILGVIAAPLANIVISYFKTTDVTMGRLTESHDAQIGAAYFGQDVQAVGVRDYADTTTAFFALRQSIETAVPATGGTYPCGAAGTPDAVVRLAWDDFGSGTSPSVTQTRVAYVVEGHELHRVRCDASAAVTSDVVLAHDLADPAPGVQPAVVTCASQSGAATACTGSGTAVPASVSLVLTIHDPRSPAGTTYAVTLTGQRRQT